MYNEAFKLIKIKLLNKDNNISFFTIRKGLMDIKANIQRNSGNNRNNYIGIHDLDLAIKLACTNVKSCLTNMKNRNIKHFRLRYWKFDKKIKILDFEKINFCDNSIKKRHFGNIDSYLDGKKFKLENIKCDSRLIYNDFDKKYTLYVPIKEESTKRCIKKGKLISLDPGLRTFLSGISESHVVKIGTNCSDKINNYLNRIDKINNNDKITNSKKRKCEKRYNKKLGNYINELHWKTINYLINSYKTILIGDMSPKRIVSNDNNLQKKQKRICHKLKFFIFRERLRMKCEKNKCNYECVDESYTSRVCSNCGSDDDKLGSKKIYDCKVCKKSIDRDINGSSTK